MNFDIAQWSEAISSPNGIAIGAFTLIAIAIFGVAQTLRRLSQDPLRDQLAAISGEDVGPVREERVGQLTAALAAQLPEPRLDSDALDQELRRAGYYRPTARSEFLALRNALVIGSALMTGAVAVMIGPERPQATLRILICGFVISVLCWATPRLMLRLQGRRRLRRIQKSLPDALDLVSMCLTGGLSLHKTLGHVSREIVHAHPDLAVELIIVRQQAEMTSLDIAFRQFAKRIDAPEIQSMTSIVAQAQRLGTDMVASIRDYADMVRLKRRQHADETASKAGMRLLFPLVFCLMPAAFIVLWGPAALQLGHFFKTYSFPHPQSIQNGAGANAVRPLNGG